MVETKADASKLFRVKPTMESYSALERMRGLFDFVTARAVSALPMLAELCLPYLKVGGTFCAMKGPRG